MKRGIIFVLLVLFLFVSIISVQEVEATITPFGIKWPKTLTGPKDLGAQTVRLSISWNQIEPNKDDYAIGRLERYDEVFDFYSQNGIEPFVTLRSASRWGSKVESSDVSSLPKDMEEFREFVGFMVNRYKDRVKYWQFENEVNSPGYWQGTKEEYGILLKNGSQTVRQVNPEAKVVLQGIAGVVFEAANGFWPYNNSDEQKQAQNFLDYMFDNLSEYYDVVDFHQYRDYDISERFVGMINDYMDKYGYEKPITSSELGALSMNLFTRHEVGVEYVPVVEELLQIPRVSQKWNIVWNEITPTEFTPVEKTKLGEFLKNHSEAGPILEKYQAENLVKRVTLTISLGVEKIHWLCMQDVDGRDQFHVQMCLKDSDERKKPHYFTYKLMIDKLKGLERIDKLDEGLYKAEFPDNDSVHIAWNDDGGVINLTQYGVSGVVNVTHIITERNNTDEDAVIETLYASSIPLNETPVFVEESEVTLTDVLDAIDDWVNGFISLEEVLGIIESWASV